MEDCPISFPYEYILYNLCYQSCFSDDFFLKKCKIKNKNSEIREELINQIYKDIVGGILNPLFFPVFEENNDLTVIGRRYYISNNIIK